jgi:hypothetical protein
MTKREKLRVVVYRPGSLIDPRILAEVVKTLVLYNIYGWS